MTRTAFIIGVLGFAQAANAGIVITEYMYTGNGPEFVEFCNTGETAVNMTGWSYDDDSQIPGVFDLSLFGNVVSGECVVITEGLAGPFNTDWGLGGTVKILGGYVNNLGRNDEINLFDHLGGLVDRLNFGDEEFPGSIRATAASGWVSAAGAGTNDPYAWTLSTVGDFQGSWTSNGEDIGSPGVHNPVPEPATLVLLSLAALVCVGRRGR